MWSVRWNLLYQKLDVEKGGVEIAQMGITMTIDNKKTKFMIWLSI